jgi:hypothetical protein
MNHLTSSASRNSPVGLLPAVIPKGQVRGLLHVSYACKFRMEVSVVGCKIGAQEPMNGLSAMVVETAGGRSDSVEQEIPERASVRFQDEVRSLRGDSSEPDLRAIAVQTEIDSCLEQMVDLLEAIHEESILKGFQIATFSFSTAMGHHLTEEGRAAGAEAERAVKELNRRREEIEQLRTKHEATLQRFHLLSSVLEGLGIDKPQRERLAVSDGGSSVERNGGG